MDLLFWQLPFDLKQIELLKAAAKRGNFSKEQFDQALKKIGPLRIPNHIQNAEKLRQSLFLSSNGVTVDGFSTPPPAHMGFSSPYHHLDPAKVHGLSRSPMYPFGVQYPYSGLPEASQVAASWHQSMYSISGNATASAGFRNYPSPLSIPPSSLPSEFYRFSTGGLLQGPGLPPHPGLGHHLVGSKHDAHSHLDQSHRSSLSDQKSSDSHGSKNASESGQSSNSQNEKKKPHIKKPLNAFMLYMKEMRAKVVAECTLKESAAINQILGRRWHSLSREEQAKYYEKARQERQLHMQLYPGWSARDNYGYGAKKKKRKKEKTSDGGNSMKKCRARYGLDQQSQWCKPCRRKKKCIRYLEGNGDATSVNSPDDNLGSAGSAGDVGSPDSKGGMDSDFDGKSSDMGMSSPNFSLTSPGMSMTSPGMSLPSPALTSPSGILPSPASLASPAVSLPSLQSPMTPSLSDERPVSSSANFTTTTTSNSTSSSSNNNNGSMNSPHLSSSSSNPSPSSSYKFSNHHHLQNNHNAGPSHNLGFGLGHLFNTSAASNLNIPFPFPMGLKDAFPRRNPVGANPHDINNPLSVNQLTGQCNSSSSSSSSASSLSSGRSSSSSLGDISSHKSNSRLGGSNRDRDHRGDRSRDTNDNPSMSNSSSVKSENNNTNNPPAPAPVIGVS
ncbi:unnamed protein product [Orchesella dallaii]|uniref:HMG box domain-containing protein n=1 Tax=Orchesella dallaii TaxID=48710 RepID=A0ABP1RFA0_9HEXA